MARFKGDISGQRGTASRLGSANSGIRGHIRGWNVGVRVVGDVDNSDNIAPPGRDTFTVYATGGSAGALSDVMLGTLTRKGDRLVFTRARRLSLPRSQTA